jgi:Mrp family chromosome partitioning ATPase
MADNFLERAMSKAGSGGAAASEPPLRVVSSSRPPTGAEPGTMGLGRFPTTDTDFERFEMRFGINPGQQSSFDNDFRIVRTQVLQSLGAKGGQVVGITSPTPRNGKTVSAIHLARACARRREQCVVLADLNLQRPLVGGYLDARDYRSAIGYFRGEGSAEEYLTRVNGANLLLFMSDRATSQSAELLASGRLKEALDTFRNVAPNTVVIVNLPPILGSDDVMTIMPELDGVVMIAAASETSFSKLEEAAGLVPEEKLLCAILNKSRDVTFTATAD